LAPEVADAGAVRGSAVGDDEVAAQMQRLLGQMQAGKIPLPKIVP
jgi:Zn-dependent alcohol dehydrogenase